MTRMVSLLGLAAVAGLSLLPTTLTAQERIFLACSGTYTQPGPTNSPITVAFELYPSRRRVISNFGETEIAYMNERFYGFVFPLRENNQVTGTIEVNVSRLTGETSVTAFRGPGRSSAPWWMSLTCRPANQLF